MGFARLYTLTTPFAGTELFDIGYEQSADIMYLTHVSHPPQKLARYAEAEWTIGSVIFGTLAAAPTGVSATAVGSSSDSGYVATTYSYVVTTIDLATGQESLQSSPASCVGDILLSGHYNTVAWSVVTDAQRYRVYKLEAGVYGYIGSTAATSLQDNNIGPDTGDTPPGTATPFNSANNYPARVTLHQQRSVWGRTNTRPSALYTSRSADLENLNTSFPLRADDAISFNLLARQVNAIEHMISMNQGLLVLTRDAAFSVAGSSSTALVADNAPDIRTQSYRGASKVRPAVIDDTVFFNTKRGGTVRTIGYTFEADGYRGNDLTVYAPHFFKGFSLIEMAWAEYPTGTLWCVRSDGALVCLTWQAEQNVWGWSLCTIQDGIVESVAVINYNGEDVPYFVVRRYINGATRRYVERLGSTNWVESKQAVYLDASLTYAGDGAATFYGFQHLEGETVTALGDGFEFTGLVVTGGKITLPTPVSYLVVGKPYRALIETLPLALAQTPLQGRQRQVGKVAIKVLDSAEVTGGIDENSLYPCRDQDELPAAVGAPQLVTGYLQLDADPDWSNDGTMVVVGDGPYPMNILGVFPSFDIGG